MQGKLTVLLIGSGGREHALAWKLSASPMLASLFIAPGNPGTAQCGSNVALDVADHAAVAAFCQANNVNFVVVGPEAPLTAGLADDLRRAGILVFGHGREAARLEGSKAFTKDICQAAGIPTAAHVRVTSLDEALGAITRQGAPIVVKYDGLAQGKGVTVAETVAEAEDAVRALYSNEPGAVVVLEEMLIGPEVSFFALVHGEQVLPLAAAQDHKRVGDGDTGPNTGGMGAYSPTPVFTSAIEAQVMATIIQPTARAMAARGTPCNGVLFAGLMLTDAGPKLIEYNVRFGDPECQVLMLRMADDLLALLHDTACGRLAQRPPTRWHDNAALTVVLAARGYPSDPLRGTTIRGLEQAAEKSNVTIFHAGTTMVAGEARASGGRVLNVSATGQTLAEAKTSAYAAVDSIDWPEGFCRRDIGWRAL